LRGGAKETPATEKILEKLALPSAAPVMETPKPVPATGPKLDEKKLEAMARPEPPAPAKKTGPEQKSTDLSQANEKLSSLLGDKK
jgi:hypothetical protein